METSSCGFVYSDTGGDGPAVVLLHGVLMNGTLWDDVVDRLRGRYRCIIPESPFGAHRTPMPDDADLDLESLASATCRRSHSCSNGPSSSAPSRDPSLWCGPARTG